MKRSSLCLPRVLACGLVLCVALFVPSSAGQKGAAQKKKETQESAAPLSELDAAAQVALKNQKKATKVFTNADLRRLNSGAPPRVDAPDGATQPATQPAAQPAQPEQDLLQQMLAGRDRAEERRRDLAAAQKELTAAQNRVTELEKRLLSVRNPFLARQRPAEEAAGDWGELDAKQRVKRSEEELEQARKNVQEVRQRIARLR